MIWPLPHCLRSRDLFSWRHSASGGRYFVAGVVHRFTVDVAMPINTMITAPFLTARTLTIDRIAFEIPVAGGAGSVARAGIYANTSESDLRPSTLLADGGEHDCTIPGVKSASVSLVLRPETLYWFAYLPGVAAPTIRLYMCPPILGSLETDLDDFSAGWNVAQAYGPLPNPFPGGATFGGDLRPGIAVRLAP